MPERGPVQPGQHEGLVPGRLLPGVDVDEREGGLPGVREATGPGMDLEARLVAEPAQGRGPVGDEVVVGAAVAAAVDAGLVPAGQPLRRGLGDVLLPEPGRPGTVGEALEVERPAVEVAQHRRGDPREVADELAFRDRAGGRRRLGAGVGPSARTAACRGWSASARRPRRARRPPCPSAASASSSASVTRQASGASAGGAAVAFDAFGVLAAPALGGFGISGASFSAARTADVVVTAVSRTTTARVATRLEALVGGLADHPVARPATELRPDHELRPDPGHAAEIAAPAALVVLGRRRIERRVVDGQGAEPLQQAASASRR